MKLQKIKVDNELPVGEKLVKGELRVVDGTVKGVFLKFESGKILQASVESYNEFHLLRQAEPKKVTKYQVKATVLGLDATKNFETYSEACEYRDQVKALTHDKYGNLHDGMTSQDLEVKTVEVLESEPLHATADEIPF